MKEKAQGMKRHTRAKRSGTTHRRGDPAGRNTVRNMNSSKPKSKRPPRGAWAGIKTRLKSMDGNDLVDLIHTIYESDPEVKQGLEMRFVPSEECITRARKRIVDLVYPDPLGSRSIQADKAFKAIKKFYRVSEDPVSTCTMLLDGIGAGTAQAEDIGVEDDGYFAALDRMMRMLVSLQNELSRQARRLNLSRMVGIHKHGRNVAYGHGYGLTETLEELRRLYR